MAHKGRLINGRFKQMKLHPGWKGNKATYSSIHSCIRYHYGIANKCEDKNCNGKSKRYDWANISGKYKRIRSDWKMLCRSCHVLLDRKNKCRKGHLYTNKNTYINPNNGIRRCKLCKIIWRINNE